ncbi:MAG TPA: SDR family oxidoreductase [Bryobacteraceae bacterium]|nr:SDR family oxidoreductase [Bryobacteraceae bacterium]
MNAGRTILIAGSRLGIGRALAAHYAGRDHEVAGLSRGESDLAHPRYRHFACDVSDEARLQQVAPQITPPPEVVIYSAGLKVNQYAMLTGCGQADSMLRTNLLGAFLVTRQFVRRMKRAGFGRFIYLTSMAVPLGSPGTVMYGASKAGLEQMAYALSREFPKDNITFNCLGISIYPSRLVDEIEDKALDAARASLVKPESLELEEIAAAIDFFASDQARQITGQTLYFGGLR